MRGFLHIANFLPQKEERTDWRRINRIVRDRAILPERRMSRGVSPELSGRAGRPQRHRGRSRQLCGADEKGRELLRAMPLSQRKDGLVLRLAGQADLPLLRLQEGRRRHQLHHGGGEPVLPRRGAFSCQARESARSRGGAGRGQPPARAAFGAQPRCGALLLRAAAR